LRPMKLESRKGTPVVPAIPQFWSGGLGSGEFGR